jgi:hypothetical protein
MNESIDPEASFSFKSIVRKHHPPVLRNEFNCREDIVDFFVTQQEAHVQTDETRLHDLVPIMQCSFKLLALYGVNSKKLLTIHACAETARA